MRTLYPRKLLMSAASGRVISSPLPQFQSSLRASLHRPSPHVVTRFYATDSRVNNRGRQSDHAETIRRLRDYMEMLIDQNGDTSELLIPVLTSLSEQYYAIDEMKNVVDVLERAIAIHEKHYGKHHIGLSKLLNDLSCAYGELKDLDKKEALLFRALKINESHFGKGHYTAACIFTNLAMVYIEKKIDPILIKELLDHIVSIQEKAFGKDSLEVALAVNNAASAYGELGHRLQQKILLEGAYKTVCNHPEGGETHPIALGIKENIKTVSMLLLHQASQAPDSSGPSNKH